MKLGFSLWCWTKAQSLQSVSKVSPDPKWHASLVQCDSDADWLFWLWGHNSSWISSSWPDSEQGILSESDENAERGSEEKKVWFVERKKMVAPSWQCSYAFVQSDSWFCHKTWDVACPRACLLTRPFTRGLLSLHQAATCIERTVICVCWGN